MKNKFKILFIVFSVLLISTSPVIAAESNIDANSLTEFALFNWDIFHWFSPAPADVKDMCIENETFKHTYSNGTVDVKNNYYVKFHLNSPSDNSLNVKVISYDKNGKKIDTTEETITGSEGDYRISINPSAEIKKSNVIISSGDDVVFNKNTSFIESTTDEKVDQPVEEPKDTSSSSSGATYVASSKSGKFHYPSCEWGQKISSKNKVVFHSRDEAINSGYSPCQVCGP